MVGLGGKGIIDMYVVAPGSDFSELAEALQAAGYEHRPRGDQPGKRFFRTDKVEADGHQQRYHIHLAGSDHPDYHRTIAFRDYLRTNAAARERYAAAKQKAAVVADGNGEVYMRTKESVIGALLAEARMPGLS